MSITAGYHRLYAHRTYTLHNKVIEFFILLFGTLNLQNSVLMWAQDHRLHHKFVDTDKDPYSIMKGFWHAHFIWIIEKKKREINEKVIPDLIQNKLLMWQHKYYVPLIIITTALSILFFGWLFQDLFGAFVFIFLVRLFISHHCTWFINSLAHMWGSKPYSSEHSAVNNWIIAFFTFGEGYHNYHHVFERDYRNGIRWYQYDPGKIMIWILGKLGLAKNIQKIDKSIIRKKLLMEDKKLLLEQLKDVGISKKEEITNFISNRADSLRDKLTKMQTMMREYQRMKKEKREKALKSKKKDDIKSLKKSIQRDFKLWSELCKYVLKLQAPSH